MKQESTIPVSHFGITITDKQGGMMDWIVFKFKGRELCSYTTYGTFAGELEATKEMLADEYGCDADDIAVSLERRK